MHFVRFFTCIASCLSVARAFSVTVGTPTQCGPLNISWTGGQAPFEILLAPSLQTYQNYTVPASGFSNGKGSFSILQLPLPTGTTFLLVMSDATRFGSGGTTNILTVGSSVGDNVCSTAVLSPPYTFQLDPLPPIQCSPFTILAQSTAVLPITIVQLIPGGQLTVFYSNNNSFTSVTDVTGGTNLMYFVTDSLGRQGGISGFEQVVGTGNFSCISTTSPSITAGISSTTTTPSTSSSSASSSATTGTSSNDVAIIAGTVGGSAAVLIGSIILGMCLWRKRRASRPADVRSPTQRYPGQLQRTDPNYKVSPHGDIPSSFPFPSETQTYYVRPIQHSLGAQSDMTNPSAGNFALGAHASSFNQTQYSRQSSNTDSPVYGDVRSTVSSAYNRQSPPSFGNFTTNDPRTPFNQTSHSRQGSNADSAAYGDTRNLAMSSVDRRMTTVAESPSQLSQEADPVSYLGPPIQSGLQSSPLNALATNLAARDHHAPFNQAQPWHQSSNTDFAPYGDAQMSDVAPVEYMAVGAGPTPPSPRKTVPVYLTPPVQPGIQSIATSADNIAVKNSLTPFNQTQNFSQSPDTDSLAVHEASGGQTMASANAQTGADNVVPGNNSSVEPPPQYSDGREVRVL
ncbi:uncharacterized protein F5891DRAFT_1058979 [Suillus fuscotomentosus]|uniref:Uncharacterized protein n=1 Tax=Suillus fuscotomentosus TaxID=1912939 RepID=A0AAD4DXA5_9AGAM|nr:uncharacterized protein F5891DRAFT_1058979 [Suillus fuscotomentosus]KAG1895352.1 hypothetical protein F5891DRAFT_1058979 [Suillus fuscotomentosus]